MNREKVMERTRAYIMENFLYARPDFQLEDDIDLLAHGIIDSMGVMEVIEFIQEQFSVQVGDDEVTEDNLGSVSAIGTYITRKLGATPSSPS